jgi:dUTP pyrophosphatase
MESLIIKVVNQSKNPLPVYETAGAAGMDIRADLEVSVLLQPQERALIPTGLFFEIPEGYEAQIRPRSGLAIKQGVTCLNSPGTIDSDYRGEIRVILINLSQETQTIQQGDRIAQVVFNKVERAMLQSENKLSETRRGEGGFGHTGKR